MCSEIKTLEFFEEKTFGRFKEWGITKNYRKTFLMATTIEKSSKAECNMAQMENEAMTCIISG